MGRRTLTSEERRECEAIAKTLKVSNYYDEIIEGIHSGAPPKIKVPNYKEPTKGEVLAAAHSNTPLPHEKEGMTMTFDELYKLGGIDVSSDSETQFSSASNSDSNPDPSVPRHTVTQNQWQAIRKYPGLVDFLGQSHGEKIARQISEQLNIALAETIQKNSQEANGNASLCEADKQNLKQYFQTDDWICRVTASGPFCENDAIFYSRERDMACVLRKDGADGSVKYADVSSKFNIIFEASGIEKQTMEKEENEKATGDSDSDSD